MTRFDQRVSLKIDRPRTSIVAHGAILFVLACIISELIARTPFVQAQIPYQAYGTNHTQLELQLNILDKFVQENGAPDCFIFGSSQAFREVDAIAFAQAFEAANGEKVTCYNFGVTGSQIWTTSILNKILIQKYQPKLVVIGTSFLDYTEGREFQIDERFMQNEWLKYQTGQFTISGWLTEHSYAWRAITLFSYSAPYGLRMNEVLREAHKWDGEIAESGFALSEKAVNPNLPVDTGFVKNLQSEFGNFGVSERNLSALEETIAFSQEMGTQVLIAEMIYHPAMLELKDAWGNPRADKEQTLSFIDKVNARLRGIASDHKINFIEADPTVTLPETGWFDLYHLNRIGAEVFSNWLGGQVHPITTTGPVSASRQSKTQASESGQITILSIKFLAFVLITLAIYYLMPGRWQNLILLIASYYFYSTWLPHYPILLLALTIINYGFGHWLYRSTRTKRAVLWTGILFNIAFMLWFLVGAGIVKPMLEITLENAGDIFPLLILPVGLSYYTLNSISYLLDINLRLSKPATNFVDFALYLAWFPKLISGPLERARKFLPQLAEKQTVDNETLAHGLTLILAGLFRTAILGGMLTLFLPAVPLGDPSAHGTLVLIWALVTYMFYLYNQFAGYTDIVRGVSGLFGIQLTRNFNTPFFSKDFSDFWQRWHISLSQWLRDYVYMPLSRAFLRRNPSRTNIPNLIVPPLVTMLISGFWHGADLNHLVWGALMGLFILIENVRMLFRPAVAEASIPLWRRISSRVWLVALMTASTIPFVLDLKQTQTFFVQLVKGWDGQMFDLRPMGIVALSMLIDWFQHRSNDEAVFRKWTARSQSLLIAFIPLAVIVIDQLQSAPPVFVYP